MAIAQPMTDLERKAVALRYLKAFDNAGVTEEGASILELFAENAEVYFPKWGVAHGRDEIGRMFGDIGATLKSILHDYDTFTYVMTGTDTFAVEGGRPRLGRRPLVRHLRGPRRAHSALFHLSRPGLRWQRHRAVPVVGRQSVSRTRHRGTT